MSISVTTRYLGERPDLSSLIDGTVFGAAAGAVAILTMKVSMLWVALQAM